MKIRGPIASRRFVPSTKVRVREAHVKKYRDLLRRHRQRSRRQPIERLKLFRICTKASQQEVYYNPGIGTIASDDAWSRFKKKAWALFCLATGYGLDGEIKGAYRFLCARWEPGDRIFFGFSRGAYTVRALAGFLHMVGLLPSNQSNLINYALTAYKRACCKKAALNRVEFRQCCRRAPRGHRFHRCLGHRCIDHRPTWRPTISYASYVQPHGPTGTGTG